MHLLILSAQNSDQAFSSEQLTTLKTHFPDLEISVTSSPTIEECTKADILIPIQSIKNLHLSQFPNLKWIHVTSAGIDALPDEVKHSEIIVTNSSGVHPVPISEHIFAFILMFARSMHKARDHQHAKQWDRASHTTWEVAGKTVAIIGLGRIGERTAHLAQGFQMNVLAVVHDKSKHLNPQVKLFDMTEIDAVLKRADIVVNCLPGTEETRNVYTFEKFKLMKPTAYFITIGRGFSVVEKDLIEALNQGVIAGAGMDVFETEPLSQDSPLWEMENVIITPHIAGKTPEYMYRVMDIFTTNLKAYQTNQPMPTLVDKIRGY